MSDTSERFILWDEFHAHCKVLVDTLKHHGPFTGIIAIARGGLIPAGIISTQLDIRNVDSIAIQSYDGRTKRGHTIHKMPSLAGGGILVIDDLSDSGGTLRYVRTLYPDVHIATVYAKPAGLDAVDSYVECINQDCWIHFPWE